MGTWQLPGNSDTEHLSVVFCGYVDNGKSTTTCRLIFEPSGLPEHELEKLKTEAELPHASHNELGTFPICTLTVIRSLCSRAYVKEKFNRQRYNQFLA